MVVLGMSCHTMLGRRKINMGPNSEFKGRLVARRIGCKNSWRPRAAMQPQVVKVSLLTPKVGVFSGLLLPAVALTAPTPSNGSAMIESCWFKLIRAMYLRKNNQKGDFGNHNTHAREGKWHRDIEKSRQPRPH